MTIDDQDTTDTDLTTERPALAISSPSELIGTVPYLLGFAPTDSLVLLGLSATNQLIVTARIDLEQATAHAIEQVLRAVQRGGTADVATILYGADYPTPGGPAQSDLPWAPWLPQ